MPPSSTFWRRGDIFVFFFLGGWSARAAPSFHLSVSFCHGAFKSQAPSAPLFSTGPGLAWHLTLASNSRHAPTPGSSTPALPRTASSRPATPTPVSLADGKLYSPHCPSSSSAAQGETDPHALIAALGLCLSNATQLMQQLEAHPALNKQ